MQVNPIGGPTMDRVTPPVAPLVTPTLLFRRDLAELAEARASALREGARIAGALPNATPRQIAVLARALARAATRLESAAEWVEESRAEVRTTRTRR